MTILDIVSRVSGSEMPFLYFLARCCCGNKGDCVQLTVAVVSKPLPPFAFPLVGHTQRRKHPPFLRVCAGCRLPPLGYGVVSVVVVTALIELAWGLRLLNHLLSFLPFLDFGFLVDFVAPEKMGMSRAGHVRVSLPS